MKKRDMMHNAWFTPAARILRKEMTKEEKHLWYDFLQKIPPVVRHQKVISPYIVDFYCPSAKLVIEVDGYYHTTEQGRKADRLRDAYMEDMGLKVLRYTNDDVNTRFDDVCEDIMRYINERDPFGEP